MHVLRALSALALTAALVPAGNLSVQPVGDYVPLGYLKVPDRVGDAPQAIDVTSYEITNGRYAVTVALNFKNLDRRRVYRVNAPIDVGLPMRYGYFIEFRHRSDGTWSKKLLWVLVNTDAPGTRLACPGLSLTWSANRAVMRLPRACMSKPNDQKVRVAAYVENWAHRADAMPDGVLYSDWVRRG